MIVGIGTDIVAVARLRGMWERHGDKALDKLLAADEMEDFAQAADKGRFWLSASPPRKLSPRLLAAGVRPPVLLPAIAVGHDALGKPIFHFHGQLAEIVENRRLTAHLSISDEAEYAVAYVLLEQA